MKLNKLEIIIAMMIIVLMGCLTSSEKETPLRVCRISMPVPVQEIFCENEDLEFCMNVAFVESQNYQIGGSKEETYQKSYLMACSRDSTYWEEF